MTKRVVISIIFIIFGTGVMSYINELNTVSSKICNADSLIQNAVDTSIEQCLASDDFYLDGFNYGYNSGVADSKNNATSTTLWVWGTQNECNLLDSVMIADNSGYDSMRSARESSQIKISAINGGNAFKKNAFMWQYKNSTNNDFLQFYTWIRNTGLFTDVVYNKENGKYIPRTVCKLDLMGTGELFNTVITDYSGKVVSSKDVTAIYKKGVFGDYMLTPTALGITYINRNMLETLIKSNIEMLCAYHYMTVDTQDVSKASKLETKHVGCLSADTMYYGKRHTSASGERIVNNGVIEYDLNTVDTEIEYRAVDMFDSLNNRVLDEALGAKPIGYDSTEGYYYDGDRAKYLKNMYNQDCVSKYIVIARVKTTLKIHIQYSSPLLQLYRSLQNSASNHLDIQSMDSTGNLRADSDGLEYTYIKYVAVTP